MRTRAAWAVVAVTAACLACVAVPWLPVGIDLYAHLLWCHESQRCFAAGELPLWLPELNAGFGSPGIRLYSPLDPALGGACAVVLGTADRGLRAAAVISIVATALLVRARRGRGWQRETALLYAMPVVVNSVLGRGSWAEFACIPAAWWLLESAADGRARPWREGPALALLWLLHAPSFVMVSILLAVSAAARRDWRLGWKWFICGCVGLGLTAWHWLPLLDEMGFVRSRDSLVGGIFDTAANVLGSPVAHRIDVSIWLGWCAVALLASMIAAPWWRGERLRASLVLVCVGLATTAALPLWQLDTPLRFLQFPWRWLMPATLLAVRPLALLLGRWTGRVATAVAVAPLCLLSVSFVRDPGLTASLPWEEAGRRVNRAIEGNPWLVDVGEHRPPAWSHLAENIASIGNARVRLVGAGEATTKTWKPLRREVEVVADEGSRLELRLLPYPFWAASIDGKATTVLDAGGMVAVSVPAGRHAIRIDWAGNPLADVGLAATALTLGSGALVLVRRRRTAARGPAA